MGSDSGYAVGYKKPPKEKQFQKGQSGNPKGRPKKALAQPARDAIRTVLREAMTVTLNGEERTMTTKEMIVRSSVAQATKGDTRIARELLKYIAEDDEEVAAENKADEFVLKKMNYFVHCTFRLEDTLKELGLLKRSEFGMLDWNERLLEAALQIADRSLESLPEGLRPYTFANDDEEGYVTYYSAREISEDHSLVPDPDWLLEQRNEAAAGAKKPRRRSK